MFENKNKKILILIIFVAVVVVVMVDYSHNWSLFEKISNSLMTNHLNWLVGIVITFLLLREVIMWYWKVNKAIALLEKIEQNTRK